MTDILLNGLSNDVAIVNGDVQLALTTGENARQRVSINLRTFAGEWAFNTLAGIPYIRRDGQPLQLLGKSDKASLDRYLVEGILTREGVDSLESYVSTLDKVTGVMTVDFVAIVEGEIEEFSNLEIII